MLQLVYGKSLYKGQGTKEELTECPYCGQGDRFHKIAHAHFVSTSYNRRLVGGTKDGTNVYHCNRCGELYPFLTFIRRCDMSKSKYKVGQAVLVDGKAGWKIDKLMNLSAKVVDDKGKTKIVPYSSIAPEGQGGGKKTNPSAPKKTEKAPAPKKTKEKSKNKGYTKSDEDAEDEALEDSAADDVAPAPPVKKYKRSVGDNISELLNKAGTPTKQADAVKKHKAFKHINKESFKKTVAQKNTLQSGLFKMRLANLLRAAIRRMDKEKA